jgi:ketosteroid isomerase-like protein
MAERNVEIVRQVYECVNGRRWDALAELLDPNVAQYGTVGGVEEGTVVHGPSEIAQLYESEADAWDRQRIEPEHLRDGRVVRIQGYMDRAAALEAAGLSEEDAHPSS